MAKTEREHREEIVEIGRLIFQKSWVAANDGNISVRLDAERILVTPSGVCKGMMKPEELLVADLAGNRLSGNSRLSTELGMHLAIYHARPDVHAVVHAHPPYATGFAAAGRALNRAILPEVVLTLGCVPLAAYGTPGTAELVETLKPLIPNHHAILMANHGLVCYGEDVFRAYFRLETVEHFAHVALVAELLGGATELTRAQVAKLTPAPANGVTLAAPFTAEDSKP